jgi:Tfp pilus assembly protein PilF
MKRFSMITFAFLFFAFAFSVFAQDETRASRTWAVEKYDLTATLPQAENDRNLTARAVLNLRNVSSRAASTLTLRISQSANVTSVKINEATADFTKGEEKIGANGSLQKIVVRVPQVQPNGNLSAAIEYKLNVKENSGLGALSPVGAQFLPLSFWYPTPNSWYFARGADFAPFSLKVNAANNLQIVSSGAAAANGFEQKLNGQPFFAAGDWETTNTNNVGVLLPKGVDAEAQKRAGELATLAANARNFTAKFLGAAPDAPLRIVAVTRGAGFSGGGTIFVDENVFRRSKIDALTAMNIAEAVAKMWIGNAAQIDGDGFGVVREGLPRFIATEFLESEFGRDIADVERMRQRTAYAAIVQRDAPLSSVSPLDDYYYSEVANKGAMVWRLLAKRTGQDEFFNVLRTQLKEGNLSAGKLREAFPRQKEFLDFAFDQVTDMNLLVGLPRVEGAETKLALRNTGSIDANVNVVAATASGERVISAAVIPAKSFGEVTFKTTNKIVRAEIDAEKFYPQTDYSDDVAPRESDASDAFLTLKRAFDKQDYVAAEKMARTILQFAPRFDDARVLLARSLLAQNKLGDAEKEFRAALDEKLPTARSLAWANEGLGELFLKSNQTAEAAKYFNQAINAEGEYGATAAARAGRNKTNAATATDESIKAFFAQFDKAATSGRKSEVDALVLNGEIARFAGGVAGAQQWQTRILQTDKKDANNVLVETALNIKLLNKDNESGTALFRLTRVGGNWKLSGVEMFEVR